MLKHAFLELIEVQARSKTLYCGGFDLHPQKDFKTNPWQANMRIYGFRNGGQSKTGSEAFGFYEQAASLEGLRGEERTKFAGLLTAIEDYLFYVLDISIRKCNLGVFKPQFGFYIQFGPSGVAAPATTASRIPETTKNRREKDHCHLGLQAG